VIDDPSRLPAARRHVAIRSDRAGFVRSLAARPVGHATMLLGAGRSRMDSPVDHAVGVVLHKKVGEAVDRDEPLCTLLVNDEARLAEAEALIRDAYTIAEAPGTVAPLIIERLSCPWSVVRGPLYADADGGGRCETRDPATDNGQRTTDK
jgi:thymidine phosphorylase